jgi:micrococcal nuclease
MYQYDAIITEVVDGDTVTAEVDLGFRTKMTDRFRLYGINAPELKLDTKIAGEAAKNRLKELILGKRVTLHTFKDRQEKYGRFLAEIFITINDPVAFEQKRFVSVNRMLVEEGHAVNYML